MGMHFIEQTDGQFEVTTRNLLFDNIFQNHVKCFHNFKLSKSQLMKTYKIKSLIYLSCFIIAAIVYYHIEQGENFQHTILSSQTADIQPEDATIDEDVENDMQQGLE